MRVLRVILVFEINLIDIYMAEKLKDIAVSKTTKEKV